MISSNPFHALLAELRARGFTAQAARLEGLLNGVWTSSSELLGELGAELIAIHRECKPASAEQKALVRACLKEVRKAWPGFGLFSFFPPW